MAQRAEETMGGRIPFSEWWRSLLERLELSQEDGAHRVGVTRNTSHRWATGASQPRYDELCRIAEVFGELPPFRAGVESTRVLLQSPRQLPLMALTKSSKRRIAAPKRASAQSPNAQASPRGRKR